MPATLPDASLRTALPAPARLALAYAPRAAQPTWLGFLALDARLAQVVRQAREPLIGQIRLAWWRERLGEAPEARPSGEPLLALLREWGEGRAGLIAMVDGWEVLLGEPPLSPASVEAAVAGRAAGAMAVAHRLEQGKHVGDVERLARNWAAADFASRVGDEAEAGAFQALAGPRKPRALPRALRPLVVLEGLANATGSGAARLATAVRLGIMGR